jgi:hypothetical protein
MNNEQRDVPMNCEVRLSHNDCAELAYHLHDLYRRNPGNRRLEQLITTFVQLGFSIREEFQKKENNNGNT